LGRGEQEGGGGVGFWGGGVSRGLGVEFVLDASAGEEVGVRGAWGAGCCGWGGSGRRGEGGGVGARGDWAVGAGEESARGRGGVEPWGGDGGVVWTRVRRPGAGRSE